VKKNYWIKKKDKEGKIIWRKGRASGLNEAKGRIGNITKNIKELLKKKKQIKILEIGAGFGRTLLELKKIFGEKIETFGTNYENEWNQKLAKEYGLDQGFSETEIPKIYIKVDAGKKLPFKNNSFDFIFCQATMQYITDRALFIEETNRILTKEGIAVLELQEYRSDHTKKYENLIEVWSNNKRIDFLNYLGEFKNIKVKKSKDRDWHYIIMKKVKKLNLNLKLTKFIDLEKISPKLWGKKVIYIK
jgi:ubiquinone/menaquinone biosynthesis C-methylase UbiE